MKKALRSNGKNLVHPCQPDNSQADFEKVDDGEKNKADELAIVIPIRTELNYFDRRLQVDDSVAEVERLEECHNFIVKRFVRQTHGKYTHGSLKYEILSGGGRVYFYVTERTEYFVKSTACCSKPHDREFYLVSSSTGCEILRFVVEFGLTDCCAKIKAFKFNRQVGCTSCRYSIIPSLIKYIISLETLERDEDESEAISVKPTEWLKSLLCFNKSSNFYEITCGGRGIPKLGKIKRDTRISGFYYLNLFKNLHFNDPTWKLMLVSVIILIDLQTDGIRGSFKCDLVTCCLQVIASMSLYVVLCFIVICIFLTLVVW